MKSVDKIKGGIVGAACGDAINKFFRYLSYQDRKKNIEYNMNMYENKVRHISDDTKMLMVILKSILELPEKPFEAIGKGFIDIYNKDPENLGLTMRIVIAEYIKYGSWKKASLKTHLMLGGRTAGCGSLIRSIPIAVYYNSFKKMIEVTKTQSTLTHFSKKASDACVLYNILIYRYIRGNDKIKVLEDVLGHFWDYKNIFTMNEKDLIKSEFVIDILRTSIWCFVHTNSYEEALKKAMDTSGDKESIGIITGGLCGAYYGFSKIKRKWVNNLFILNRLLKMSTLLEKYSIYDKKLYTKKKVNFNG